jgi:hypothetical protein
LQPLEGRLLQQNQRVPDIVPVSVGMGREDFFDARGQAPRPALGAWDVFGSSGLFHAATAVHRLAANGSHRLAASIVAGPTRLDFAVTRNSGSKAMPRILRHWPTVRQLFSQLK